MRRTARSSRSTAASVGVGAAGLVALGLSAWEGTVVQSSAAAHWSVLAVIAVVLATVGALGPGCQRMSSADWARRGARTVRADLTGAGDRPAALVWATVAWVVLAAATVGWDLNSFAHQAHDLPTLSRLVGAVTRHSWGRALAFALWLGLGAYLAAGGRRRRARRGGEAT